MTRFDSRFDKPGVGKNYVDTVASGLFIPAGALRVQAGSPTQTSASVHIVWRFADTAGHRVSGSVFVPSNWSAYTAHLVWAATTATIGTVQWTLRRGPVTAGAALGNTAESAITPSTDGTAVPVISELTAAPRSVTGGSIITLAVQRDAGGGTYTAAADILGIEVRRA